jgi:hypothetical protein
MTRSCLLGLAALALCGCQLNSFHSTLVGETTVPGDASGAPLTSLPAFGSFSDLDFAENEDFVQNGVKPSEINSAKVTSLTLEIVSPATQGFSFLDEVSFYARAGDTLTLIAEKHDIPSLALTAPNPKLSLDVTGVDLTPFITGSSVALEVRGSGRTPPEDTQLRATVDFELRVNVF